MTCIAWDGNTLAADKRAVMSGMQYTVTKIHRLVGSGDLFGCSGDLARGLEMKAWIESGCDVATFPKRQEDDESFVRCIIISQDKKIILYEDTPYQIYPEDSYVSIGSGSHYAMAAMHLGLLAEDAVGIACHFDTSCGNGIDTLTL